MSHPDDPRVPSPCSVPVSTMEPREKGRLCRECDTLVLDTARHTKDEFLSLVRAGGKVCAQLRKGDDGRVRFADSPLRRRLQVVALSAALAGCGDDAVGVTVAPSAASPTTAASAPAPPPPPTGASPAAPPAPVADPEPTPPPGLVAPPAGWSSTPTEPAADPAAPATPRRHRHHDEDDDGPVGLVGL